MDEWLETDGQARVGSRWCHSFRVILYVRRLSSKLCRSLHFCIHIRNHSMYVWMAFSFYFLYIYLPPVMLSMPNQWQGLALLEIIGKRTSAILWILYMCGTHRRKCNLSCNTKSISNENHTKSQCSKRKYFDQGLLWSWRSTQNKLSELKPTTHELWTTFYQISYFLLAELNISFIYPVVAIYMATWPAVWIKVYGPHRLEFALSVFMWSLGIAMLVSKPLAGKRSKSTDAISKQIK